MAQFRTLSAPDVQEILRAFGGDVYRAHQPIAVGTVNTNLRVETDRRALFLRINEGKSADDVEREAGIVVHAHLHGVSTPSPLPTAGAARPYLVWRGERVSLFPWVEGRTLARAEVTPAHAAAVGRALAGLHLAMDGFADRRPGRYEPDEIEARLARVAALARPELAGAVAILAPELARLRAERAPELPMGIIHGDLFIDNVMFGAGGGLAALIDFEQASWGRLAYDLAVTTLAFGFGRDDFRPEIVRALIEGYAAARPLRDAERAAFAAELRFVACRFAVTRITDVHLKREAGAAPGKNFQRYLDRLASVKMHLAARDGLFDL
ncbi:MAG TPA: homoserine kinase [Polyangia bacterium]|jgi:homoserine kinase type II